ncbi:uncharacterized protein LOC132054441 [Lycium ferocissimum]|uniref:uncharacterized protein LOC132054441 n=1 Tax=Lycium ferocissimum TaxID=112874 RepID=UPI0028167AE9|nr:uncharacterized protein LOC132054441 [Lycium ferocissimum]
MSFDELRSMLLVQEQRVIFKKNREHGLVTHQAFAASTSSGHTNTNFSTSNNHPQQKQYHKNNGKGRGGWRGGRGGRGRGRGHSGQQHGQQQGGVSGPQQNAHTQNTQGGNSNVEGVFGTNTPPVVCQICYHPGHSAISCPSRYAQTSSTSAFAALPTGENETTTWFPDSGASSHMTHDQGQPLGGGATQGY